MTAEIPLKLKYRTGFRYRHKASSSNGSRQAKRSYLPPGKKKDKDASVPAQQKTLVILPSGKRRMR